MTTMSSKIAWGHGFRGAPISSALLSRPERAGRHGDQIARCRALQVRLKRCHTLKRSIANEQQPAKGKKPRKAAVGQKELPISGKRTAKQETKKADKPAAARTRKAGVNCVAPDVMPVRPN
jgi:hypothetical protein